MDIAHNKSPGKMVNAFNPSELNRLDSYTRGLIERRARLLGPAYRLFYKHPVQISRGSGVLLYDKDGNEYLDAYNNVVSVGHAHPRVVQAISEQLSVLCTHTRYLQEGILDYAEQLLPTFGGELGRSGHLMLTCTGSEANDLALRIAQYHTSRQGIIITAEAYHGNSHLTAGISPSLGAASPLGTWVRQIPAPDSYRIPPENMGRWLADQVEIQIRDLERHGNGLAAFIADAAFSSDGIFTHPADLLAPVAQVVHKAGGLYIADEVQSGFGRLGDTLWGYQRHGVHPDIVTMGKPMGNGYPVAAMVTREEILADFGARSRYFNTFGGSSAAMAAAGAVLDVIEAEKLMENAAETGEALRKAIEGLSDKYPIIAEVRGAGMFIGVELKKLNAGGQPATEETTRVVNGLRERGVLISASGPDANILKVRPPLAFRQAEVSVFIEALEETLQAET